MEHSTRDLRLKCSDLLTRPRELPLNVKKQPRRHESYQNISFRKKSPPFPPSHPPPPQKKKKRERKNPDQRELKRTCIRLRIFRVGPSEACQAPSPPSPSPLRDPFPSLFPPFLARCSLSSSSRSPVRTVMSSTQRIYYSLALSPPLSFSPPHPLPFSSGGLLQMRIFRDPVC